MCSNTEGKNLPKELFGYEVIDYVGEGAGSVLYAVTHPTTSQVYVLKHVVRKQEKDSRFIEQLETEYSVASRVNNPRLRRAVDFLVNRTLLRKVTEAALVLELFDGIPMDLLPDQGVEDKVHYFIQTAEALIALHEMEYVHCDLKPNNILVSSDRHVKVIDLGQACRQGVAKQRIQGTPDFIAPEQVRCEPVTEQTDVYNFGATMYWALCGQKLPTLFTVKRGRNSYLLDDQIHSPSAFNKQVPENLSNLVMQCVKTDPARRPADMHEVLQRLHIIEHTIRRTRQGAIPLDPEAIRMFDGMGEDDSFLGMQAVCA